MTKQSSQRKHHDFMQKMHKKSDHQLLRFPIRDTLNANRETIMFMNIQRSGTEKSALQKIFSEKEE